MARAYKKRFQLFRVLVLVLSCGTAQPAVAAAGVSPEVRALLKSNPTPAEARQGIHAIWQRRLIWHQQPMDQLLVYRKLGSFYQKLARPDSAYYSFLNAGMAAKAIQRQYPLEAAEAFFDLGSFHWQAQAFDSAGYYFRKATTIIEKSGYDLHSRRNVQMADGETIIIGAQLASRYAHAGMAWRRMGNLGAAVRCYELTLAYYREQEHEAGIRWGLCLLGEAYEEQGNAVRAAEYYEQALDVVATLPPVDLAKKVGQQADVLRYYADLLLAQHRPARLQELLRQTLTLEESLQLQERGHLFLSPISAEMLLIQAELWLRLHQPTQAAQVLGRLQTQPTAEATRGLATLPNAAEWRLTWHCLRAQVARQQGQPTVMRAELARAQQQLEQLTDPPRRLRGGERLATTLLLTGDYPAAARVLRTLVGLTHNGVNRLKTRDLYRLLETAYAENGRPDSAYYFARRSRDLNDTLRAAQQYAALEELEARHRAAQQQQQLRQVATQAEHERRQKQLAWLSIGLLVLLLGGVGWALRLTRQLNRRNREQARRLAELDQLKTQFFTNVSHELRTPLTLVLGPVEQALQSPADLPTPLRQLLELSVRNGRRLQQLVNGLLDFTKVEAGRLQLHPAPLRLGLFCQQVVDAFGAMAAERQIKLQFRNELSTDPTLALDGARLEQILTNLLANALRFTPPGGWVWLKAMPNGPEQWQLSVHDTGPGIAPEEQQKVFERFYQSQQRHTAGGTGIGLAFSRELAELLGGSLTLNSRLGEGSVFTLTFRAAPMANAAGFSAAEEWSSEGAASGTRDEAAAIDIADSALIHSAKVLVVEDNPDLRAYLRQILAPRYEVLEAEDGRRALEILQQESVDLICSDEMMPYVSGTELLRRVKADPTRCRLPFLMVTARADREHRFRTLELGVDDYLQKPFAPRELLARVHNLLINHRERLAFVSNQEVEVVPEEVLVSQDSLAEGSPAMVVAKPIVAASSELLTLADQELLRRARELAEAALANTEFDTPQLVAALGLSERTLYRKLKELTGLTPAAYLREVRLEHARQLLEQRAMQTVSEVAYAVGFDNPGYFATVFLKRYGKRATEYLQ